MAKKHLDDASLKRAIGSYLNQIGGALKAEGAPDIGAIVILARPDGSGEFVVHGAGVIDGRQMDGPTQRRILKALHNQSGVLIEPSKAS